MRFILAGHQFRHFRSGLHCLGKIGAELLIEALPEKLVLRSINSSRSAFVSATYHEDFFSAYDMGGATIVQAGVLMKQMAAIFRTQRARSTEFELQEDGVHLIATVDCENGLQKVYKVPCTDSEILQATVDKEGLSITVIGQADEFNRLLSSFQSSLSEITIIAMPESGPGGAPTKDVKIRSYVDPAKGLSDKALYTNLDIDSGLFLAYENRANAPSDVTFNLRDFRAMLSLCEGLRANVAIRFDAPGQPLVVGPHLRGNEAPELRYDAELILATLLESQSGNVQQEAAGRPAGRAGGAVPGSGRIRTPSVAGDSPWQNADGSAPGSGAAASGGAPPSRTYAGAATALPSAGTSGAGRSRLAQETARRDLAAAMQQLAPGSGGGGAHGGGVGRSGGAGAAAPLGDGHTNGQAGRHGSGAAFSYGRPPPAGSAEADPLRHSGGGQQHHRQPAGGSGAGFDGGGGFAFGDGAGGGGGGGGGADNHDADLDNFASLPPDEDHLPPQQPAGFGGGGGQGDGGGHSISSRQAGPSGHAGGAQHRRDDDFAYVYDDEGDADDAVPGTPPV